MADYNLTENYIHSTTTISSITNNLIQNAHKHTSIVFTYDTCKSYANAEIFYNLTRRINICATILIILIGLIGNTLAIIVFGQKRYRLKSPGVFLLCLAMSDGLFLMTHFFEDTLRTYIDILNKAENSELPINCIQILSSNNNYSNILRDNDQDILKLFNITDRFEISCRIVNYLRYFLRFVSAYIITIFTIQRAIAIYFPLYQNKTSSSLVAWRTVTVLSLFAGILCLFVPFLFKINETTANYTSDKLRYCDTDKTKAEIYFTTTIIYIALIMFLPIVTIIICNSFIIFQICRANRQRRYLCDANLLENSNFLYKKYETSQIVKNGRNNSSSSSTSKSTSTRPIGCYNFTLSGSDSVFLKRSQRKRSDRFDNESIKVTRMLILMSLSYAILNLPYFITWCIFFYTQAFKKADDFGTKMILFGTINLAEIFYVLNYGIHFFLYCASGKKFRQQLRFSLCEKRKR